MIKLINQIHLVKDHFLVYINYLSIIFMIKIFLDYSKPIETLRNHAYVTIHFVGDFKKGEEILKKLFGLIPNDKKGLLIYASCLFLQEEREKEAIDIIFKLLSDKTFRFKIRCWILLYFHIFNHEAQNRILAQIKQLMLYDNLRAENEWIFYLKLNIKKSIKQNHINSKYLKNLFQVFIDKKDISILDEWQDWRKVSRSINDNDLFELKRLILKTL